MRFGASCMTFVFPIVGGDARRRSGRGEGRWERRARASAWAVGGGSWCSAAVEDFARDLSRAESERRLCRDGAGELATEVVD